MYLTVHGQRNEGVAMLDYIPLDAFGIGSGWALVALFVILIYRGKLIPRSMYDDKVHEANEWRTEARLKDQTISEINEHKSMLMRDLMPVLERVLDAMHGKPKKVD